VYMPKVGYGHLGGGANWLLSMCDAMFNIGVFTNNRTTYDRAITYYQSWLPAHVYVQALDGNAPVTTALTVAPSIIQNQAQYWNHATLPYPDGQEQETCRDLTHEMYTATAAAAYASETARIQGDDLYTFGQARMITNHELHARWIMDYKANSNVNPSGWVCPNPPALLPPSLGWEVGYNNYHARQNLSMPSTQSYLNTLRPTSCNLHMCWDTLTYGSVLGSSATPKPCVTANAAWQTSLLNGTQTSNFFFTFKATPGLGADNGVFGLSNGAQTSYANYAIVGRFDQSGVIQAYQGTGGIGYTSVSTLHYTVGVEYTFSISVSVSTKTFSMTAQPPNGASVTIASGYGFRAVSTQLTHYGFLDSYVGNTKFCDITQNGIYLQ